MVCVVVALLLAFILVIFIYKKRKGATESSGILSLSILPTLNRIFLSMIFSSPELKAQVRFSDCLSSVVCLALLITLVTNFDQTWHEASLGEGIQVCAKMHWQNLKILFSRTIAQIQISLGEENLGTTKRWFSTFSKGR